MKKTVLAAALMAASMGALAGAKINVNADAYEWYGIEPANTVHIPYGADPEDEFKLGAGAIGVVVRDWTKGGTYWAEYHGKIELSDAGLPAELADGIAVSTDDNAVLREYKSKFRCHAEAVSTVIGKVGIMNTVALDMTFSDCEEVQ